MSRNKASRQAAVATKAAPTRKAKPAPEPEADRGTAISAGMKELAGVRTKAREKRDGKPAKPLIFSEFLKAILAGKPFDVEAIARKYPEIKESSIRSWTSYWKHHAGDGGTGYPANGRAKDVQAKLKAAVKKLSAVA